MKKILFLLMCLPLLFAGCSAEREETLTTTETATELQMMGLPQNLLISKAYGHEEEFSISRLQQMYKKDMANAGDAYKSNLDRMWYSLICSKLKHDGTQKEKLAFITAQAELNEELPYYTAFYGLVASCKTSKDNDGLHAIATKAHDTGLALIKSRYAGDDETLRQRYLDIMYGKRIFNYMMLGDVASK